MRPEINKAITLLFHGGMKRDAADIELLGRDICRIAGELAGETGDPSFYIADAARELELRIGGVKQLHSYMRTLRDTQ